MIHCLARISYIVCFWVWIRLCVTFLSLNCCLFRWAFLLSCLFVRLVVSQRVPCFTFSLTHNKNLLVCFRCCSIISFALSITDGPRFSLLTLCPPGVLYAVVSESDKQYRSGMPEIRRWSLPLPALPVVIVVCTFATVTTGVSGAVGFSVSNPTFNNDVQRAVAIDRDGNVYFLFRTAAGGGNRDEAIGLGGPDWCLTGRASNGTRLWTVILGTAAQDDPIALEIDEGLNPDTGVRVRPQTLIMVGNVQASLDGEPYSGGGGNDNLVVSE